MGTSWRLRALLSSSARGEVEAHGELPLAAAAAITECASAGGAAAWHVKPASIFRLFEELRKLKSGNHVTNPPRHTYFIKILKSM